MNKTTPTKDKTMNLNPVIWHGYDQKDNNGNLFCFIDHNGESYTLRMVTSGINIYRDIEGDDCLITQVDTTSEALDFISLYATQLIDC
jgi:hypothetical protein